jgi:hypothetical protein
MYGKKLVNGAFWRSSTPYKGKCGAEGPAPNYTGDTICV